MTVSEFSEIHLGKTLLLDRIFVIYRSMCVLSSLKLFNITGNSIGLFGHNAKAISL